MIFGHPKSFSLASQPFHRLRLRNKKSFLTTREPSTMVLGFLWLAQSRKKHCQHYKVCVSPWKWLPAPESHFPNALEALTGAGCSKVRHSVGSLSQPSKWFVAPKKSFFHCLASGSHLPAWREVVVLAQHRTNVRPIGAMHQPSKSFSAPVGRLRHADSHILLPPPACGMKEKELQVKKPREHGMHGYLWMLALCRCIEQIAELRSLRDGHHIPGRRQACKLLNPDTGRSQKRTTQCTHVSWFETSRASIPLWVAIEVLRVSLVPAAATIPALLRIEHGTGEGLVLGNHFPAKG